MLLKRENIMRSIFLQRLQKSFKDGNNLQKVGGYLFYEYDQYGNRVILF
jgi:hypothetical protein